VLLEYGASAEARVVADINCSECEAPVSSLVDATALHLAACVHCPIDDSDSGSSGGGGSSKTLLPRDAGRAAVFEQCGMHKQTDTPESRAQGSITTMLVEEYGAHPGDAGAYMCETPLTLSAHNRATACTLALLEAGANPNQPRADGIRWVPCVLLCAVLCALRAVDGVLLCAV
jgi:hypothetical protein